MWLIIGFFPSGCPAMTTFCRAYQGTLEKSEDRFFATTSGFRKLRLAELFFQEPIYVEG